MFNLLVYYDLRKYGPIEKSNSSEKTIEILQEMHSIIEAAFLKIEAELYSIHTDTGIYLMDSSCANRIPNALQEAKNKTEKCMQEKGYNAQLHITCVSDLLYRGEIKLRNKVHNNAFGPIMGQLQKFLNIIDVCNNKEIFEGIVYNDKAVQLLDIGKDVKEIEISGTKFYL